MQLIEKHQDLFREKDNAIIGHCVSLDDNLAMGIAKQFKKNYPEYAYYFFQQVISRTTKDRNSRFSFG